MATERREFTKAEIDFANSAKLPNPKINKYPKDLNLSQSCVHPSFQE